MTHYSIETYLAHAATISGGRLIWRCCADDTVTPPHTMTFPLLISSIIISQDSQMKHDFGDFEEDVSFDGCSDEGLSLYHLYSHLHSDLHSLRVSIIKSYGVLVFRAARWLYTIQDIRFRFWCSEKWGLTFFAWVSHARRQSMGGSRHDSFNWPRAKIISDDRKWKYRKRRAMPLISTAYSFRIDELSAFEEVKMARWHYFLALHGKIYGFGNSKLALVSYQFRHADAA